MGVVVYYLTEEEREQLDNMTLDQLEEPMGYLALDKDYNSIPIGQQGGNDSNGLSGLRRYQHIVILMDIVGLGEGLDKTEQ